MKKYLWLLIPGSVIAWALGNGLLAHHYGVGAEEPEWWGKVALPALAGLGGLAYQLRGKLATIASELPITSQDPVKDLLADVGRLMIENDDLAGLDALSTLLKARKKP